MNIALFPPLNACLNGLSAILLLSGFIAIKKGHKEIHKKLMISALITSTIFLACYLFYHYHAGSKKISRPWHDQKYLSGNFINPHHLSGSDVAIYFLNLFSCL